jgi:hypothetical protein
MIPQRAQAVFSFQRGALYPQGDSVIKVSKEMARARIGNLEQYVKDFPTGLILNIDEVGSQERAGH